MGSVSRKLFGTDGIRGRAGEYPLTAEMAEKVGRAAAWLVRREAGPPSTIVIGRDTRASGETLENALTRGIRSMGVNVLGLGVLPTPGVAFMTVDRQADAGVVISASHNPFEDNGLKFFGRDGFKLPDAVEARIEEYIFSERMASGGERADEQGGAGKIADAGRSYVDYLKKAVPGHINLEGLRIVVDCANGAAWQCAPEVLREMGAEVLAINVGPDGMNINRECGSLYPEAAAARAIAMRADCGMALDGDADRVIFIDHTGQVVDGDHIMALMARDLNRRGRLAGKTVVATIMSNLGLELALKGMGLSLIRTDVGDRYVVEAMRRGGYNFGGEQSGHFIFLDHNTTGDGMLSGLLVLAVMKRENRPLAELAGIMTSLPQVLISKNVSSRANLDDIPEIMKQYRLVRERLGDHGRLVVRYSGTEPKVRVMIEGQDLKEITTLAEETAACIVRALR